MVHKKLIPVPDRKGSFLKKSIKKNVTNLLIKHYRKLSNRMTDVMLILGFSMHNLIKLGPK